MDLSIRNWDGTEQFDAAYLDLARALIAEGRIGAIRDLMLVADRHPELWASEAGGALLADLLGLLLEGLAQGHVDDVVPALAICPPDLAQAAIRLLLGACCTDGTAIDSRRLDNAALLCLALLTGSTGHHELGVALLDEALTSRYSERFATAAMAVRDHLRPAM